MTDIVERLEARAYSIELAGYHQSAADMREAAAEIGRLRGEVEELKARRAEDVSILDDIRDAIGGGPYDTIAKRIRQAIAPADAKVEVPGEGWPLRYIPQPAAGGAVADAWKTVHVLMSVMRLRPLATSEQDELHKAHVTIRTHPPAAQKSRCQRGLADDCCCNPEACEPAAPVQAAPQEGDYLSAELDGVTAAFERMTEYTVVHNGRGIPCSAAMRDAYSDVVVERDALRDKLAAHPSACELGAVRIPVETLKTWRTLVDVEPSAVQGEISDVLREAALQHRGDSQEVGRG